MLNYKEIIPYIFAIGAAQGILLSLFLFKKKENQTANRLLAITMLLFALDLILEIMAVTEDIKKIPALIGLMQALPYLYGPAIYLYVLFITHGKKRFNYKYLLNYLPFVLVQIYGLFFFYFEPTSYQINLVYVESELPWHLILVSFLIPIHGVLYIGLAIREAFKFNHKLKNNFSNIDKHNLSWVKFLVVGSVLLWVIAMIMTTLQLIYGTEIRSEIVSYFAISVFIYSIAYKGLKQPEVAVAEKFDKVKGEMYKKSGLTEVSANKYYKSLLLIMDEKKPYKNDSLTLSNLANMVGTSNHNLSEVINTKIDQNFYDFINSYRVEEVKKLIEKDKNSIYSILAHGFDAGFTSKSVFYSAFKKFTRKTPSQFRKDILL